MTMQRTYKQAQLQPLKHAQQYTNREPMSVQFHFEGNKTNWLNLSPEQVQKIYDMFGEEE